jgi:hypothetical protein
MESAELARVLREATADVTPRPGFTTDVVRGGRRRQHRNRMAVATGAAAVTAIAATSTYVLWPENQPGGTESIGTTGTAAAQPQKADVITDEKFKADAIKAFQDGIAKSWNSDRGIFDDRRGEPKVLWAGTTPAGPAAVVTQEAFLHPHENVSDAEFNTMQTLVGLVAKDPADGVLKLVWDEYTQVDNPFAGQFRFGPEDRTILIVDRGIPLWWSPGPQVDDNGKITRAWESLPVTNGVAVLQAQANADDIRVLARQAKPAPDDKNPEGIVSLWPSSDYLKFAKTGVREVATMPYGAGADNRLPWRGADVKIMRVGKAVTGHSDDIELDYYQALDKAGVTDIGGNTRLYGTWLVVAGLGDGRSALVSEVQQDKAPSRIFTAIFKADGSLERVIAGDKPDKAATLPVKVHLPDGQGWVVADAGATLTFRTSANGEWQDAGKNSAVLPEGTLQVHVSKTGAPATVDLPK